MSARYAFPSCVSSPAFWDSSLVWSARIPPQCSLNGRCWMGLQTSSILKYGLRGELFPPPRSRVPMSPPRSRVPMSPPPTSRVPCPHHPHQESPNPRQSHAQFARYTLSTCTWPSQICGCVNHRGLRESSEEKFFLLLQVTWELRLSSLTHASAC